ncbi:hypothetical protein KUTeg_019330 [Tegillarca granosa]|uniref:RNA-binding protein NOB1 n=1 Tax=Tegillarca granosa TaxID=220873 RepID=A0ABQ9EC77_TEGGR|nr:hypothetical protein KUTeg_019330 [Tegillarca granosa]
MEKVQHVVADAGAFIRDAPLRNIGEKIYSLPEVVNEIKDKATKQRLQVLPYQIIFKQPSSESIGYVSDFARKTGDYRSLSAVDLKVMALTYQLEKEYVGTDHIKSAPEKKVEWNSSRRLLEKPTDIAGFYLKSDKTSSRTTSECVSETDRSHDADIDKGIVTSHDSDSQSHDTDIKAEGTVNKPHDTDIENETSTSNEKQEILKTNESDKTDNGNEKVVIEIKEQSDSNKEFCRTCDEKEEKDSENKNKHNTLEGHILPTDALQEESDEESEDNQDDDDGDGWITPANIREIKEKMGNVNTEMANVAVGCLTTDFAIQNVLIQMGLNVISVDGMLIKKAKSYVLRCFACMKLTTTVTKQFCPWCGNNTLQKVSMSVEEDGSIKYFLSRRKPVSTRGTKFALPMPKGGKHGNNPILFEDQPVPQQRLSKKARQRMDVFDPDYVAGSSPFLVNDITSRASQLGIRSGGNQGFKKRNPNEVKKHYGRRK